MLPTHLVRLVIPKDLQDNLKTSLFKFLNRYLPDYSITYAVCDRCQTEDEGVLTYKDNVPGRFECKGCAPKVFKQVLKYKGGRRD